MTHYIRVDAVNIYATVGDTEDLSTRRGLGLALLKAIDELPKELPDLKLEVISSGASSGFFSTTNAPDSACAAITKFLQTHALYQHGTFVVTQVTETDFVKATERGIAQNRWQQMQSLSLPLSALSMGVAVCNLTAKQASKKPKRPSAATTLRRKSGRDMRQDFYVQWSGVEKNWKFTNDFEKLSGEWIGNPKNLNNKIALFYADGNDFGKRQALCNSEETLNSFDQLIKKSRRSFLRALLEKIKSGESWSTSAGALRLETLLWGGDELMMVVPAWKGLELAQLFFKQTDGLDWKDASKYTSNPEELAKLKKLTHSCGLVFAHHNAPISRLQQLAQGLAEEGKTASRDANSLTWCVLESFDHIGSDCSGFLKRRYPHAPDMSWSKLGLSTTALTQLLDGLTSDLKAALPRSDINRIVRTMATQVNAFDGRSAVFDQLKRSYDNVKAAASQDAKKLEAWTALWSALNCPNVAAVFDPAKPQLQDLSAWVKLLELWDYTNPTSTTPITKVADTEGVPA